MAIRSEAGMNEVNFLKYGCTFYRAMDPMEKAELQNELDKFKNDVAESQNSNIFDTLKDNISAAKDNVGLTTAQIAQNEEMMRQNGIALRDAYREKMDLPTK